jgi:hypothetical protein
MPFIQDYLYTCSRNECPRNYHIWSALTIIAASIHKRVCINWGDIVIYPNLYVCLVGSQGSRKSTAKDIARKVFKTAFPDYPVNASVQSREDIIKYMSSDEQAIYFKDANDTTIEVRPIMMFINELKNFLSINPSGMIDFITDIYDRDYFDCSTIKHSLQDIPNPCVNILACETPKWITDKLKADIITGGFTRRVLYVYETEPVKKISFPIPPPDYLIVRAKLVKHLHLISTFAGEFKWQQEALAYWDKWYQGLIHPTDEIMAGYYQSKHIQCLKVAMLLALAEDEPKLVLTPDLLEQASALLNHIEINMPKLSVAAGRNELAVPQQKLLELLESNGGWMPEKILKRATDRDLNPAEQAAVLRHLVDTDQIIITTMRDSKGTDRLMVLTKRKYNEEKEAHEKRKASDGHAQILGATISKS